MAKILITGANKGLGHETARQLIAAGHTVYVGARDPERGRPAAEALGAHFVPLDVTDDAGVHASTRLFDSEDGLDVLINNAAIEDRTPDGGFTAAADVTADGLRTSFDTNVFGVVRVTHAFLPLLRRSSAPVIVNVSSGLARTADVAAHFYPGIAYPATKAALNMVTVQYAKAFPEIRINAVDPGYTRTDLNHNMGTQTVAEGAEVIVRMAQIGPDGPTGQFFDASGPKEW